MMKLFASSIIFCVPVIVILHNNTSSPLKHTLYDILFFLILHVVLEKSSTIFLRASRIMFFGVRDVPCLVISYEYNLYIYTGQTFSQDLESDQNREDTG